MGLIHNARRALGARLGAAVRAFSATSAPPRVEGTPPGVLGGIGQPAPSQVVRAVGSRDALFGRTTYGAGPGFTRYSTYPADAIDPVKVYSIFKQANNGYPRLQAELYEQLIESDDHLGSVALARIYAVSCTDWRVRASSESDVARGLAVFVQAALDEIDGFDHSIESLLWANAYAYAIGENVWRYRTLRFPVKDKGAVAFDALTIQQIDWVHQKHIQFDLATDAPYLWIDGVLEMPPAKFVFHTASEPGIIARRGYMRPCTLLCATKRWAIRDWLNYAHLYGVPQLEMLYDGTIEEYDEHRELYERILRDFGQGIPAIHPRDAEIKITNPPPGGRANDPQGALIGWANSEISKRVQGETLTTEMGGVGGYNTADIHADVKHNFVLSDARKLAQTLRQQVIAPLVELNIDALCALYGASPEEVRASLPTIRWRIEREMSPTDRMTIYARARNELGLALDEEQARDEFGLNSPRPGTAPLPGEAVQVGTGGVVSAEDAQAGAEPPPKEAPAPDAGAETNRPPTDGDEPEKPSTAKE